MEASEEQPLTIPLNRLGKVHHDPAGVHREWYIQVETGSSDGFFLLYRRDPRNREAEGFDDFFFTAREVNERLAGWVIEWTDQGRPPCKP